MIKAPIDRPASPDGGRRATSAVVARGWLARRALSWTGGLLGVSRASRAALLGLFIAALLFSQPLLAADQAADVAAVPGHLVAGDSCRDIFVDERPDHGSGPSKHCQACCAHQNNPALQSLALPVHQPARRRLHLTADPSGMLHSARLSVEVDPPRARA